MKLSNSKEAGFGHDEEIFSATEVRNSDNRDPAGFKTVTESWMLGIYTTSFEWYAVPTHCFVGTLGTDSLFPYIAIDLDK